MCELCVCELCVCVSTSVMEGDKIPVRVAFLNVLGVLVSEYDTAKQGAWGSTSLASSF